MLLFWEQAQILKKNTKIAEISVCVQVFFRPFSETDDSHKTALHFLGKCQFVSCSDQRSRHFLECGAKYAPFQVSLFTFVISIVLSKFLPIQMLWIGWQEFQHHDKKRRFKIFWIGKPNVLEMFKLCWWIFCNRIWGLQAFEHKRGGLYETPNDEYIKVELYKLNHTLLSKVFYFSKDRAILLRTKFMAEF